MAEGEGYSEEVTFLSRVLRNKKETSTERFRERAFQLVEPSMKSMGQESINLRDLEASGTRPTEGGCRDKQGYGKEDEFYSSCTEEPMESFKHMVDL